MIDTSRQGEVSFALADADTAGLGTIRSYAASRFATFTDALLHFEREAGIDLRDTDVVLAVAGALAGENIAISRSRWTISRGGLTTMLHRAPVIINDVAALGWALREGTPVFMPIRGTQRPMLTARGRYVMVTVTDGVGCAIIDIDAAGIMRILETEGGHCDFTPIGAAEERLADAVRGRWPTASWEQVLIPEKETVLTSGDAWQEAARLLPELLGRFAANMVLAAAAWDGVMVAGERAAHILASDAAARFDQAFARRNAFRRLIAGVPSWHVEQRDAVLTGCAALLRQRHALRGGQPPDAPGR